MDKFKKALYGDYQSIHPNNVTPNVGRMLYKTTISITPDGFERSDDKFKSYFSDFTIHTTGTELKVKYDDLNKVFTITEPSVNGMSFYIYYLYHKRQVALEILERRVDFEINRLLENVNKMKIAWESV